MYSQYIMVTPNNEVRTAIIQCRSFVKKNVTEQIIHTFEVDNQNKQE